MFPDRFKKILQLKFPQLLLPETKLLLAISGGIDSVVMVDLIHKAGLSFIIAHVNFQLRGEESTRDEMFVRSLGKKYDCEVLVKHADINAYADQHKMATQEAAREIRYNWFTELIAQAKADWVLTAHHADDNIETVLMHFFRGTGIQGMAGIKALQKERRLVRPLLSFRKEELKTYAMDSGLQFVEDSSNGSDAYTRNFFRNTLLPQIQTVFPKVEDNILQNIQRLSEVQQVYDQSVQQQLNKLVEPKGNEFYVPVLKWKKTEPLYTITWELVKKYGFTALQVNEIVRLLDANNGAYISSDTHRIIKNRNWMIISPVITAEAQHIIIEQNNKEVIFEGGELYLQLLTAEKTEISKDKTEASLDTGNLIFPLILRKWKQGDYFYPLGMDKKKKLSRFFIDQKLSKTDKEKVWVIESDKKIVWVVGHRIDNRFRVRDKTEQILHLGLKPSCV